MNSVEELKRIKENYNFLSKAACNVEMNKYDTEFFDLIEKDLKAFEILKREIDFVPIIKEGQLFKRFTQAEYKLLKECLK